MKSIKTKCHECKKKVGIVNKFDCKYCYQNFCISCLAVEKHPCQGIEIYQKTKIIKLENTLMSAKAIETNNYQRI